MSSVNQSSVWVRLHIVGETDSQDQAVEIESLPHNINALKKAVKHELKNELSHVDANKLKVYENVNLNDLGNATALDPGDPVPRNTSSKAPLIVTAPPPPQQQLKKNAAEGIQELREQMNALTIAVKGKGRPPRTLSFVSKSHAYTDAVKNERILHGRPFFFALAEPLETTAFAAEGPAAEAEENKDHHRYFLREMDSLITSAVKSGQIKIRQQIFWTKSGQWLKLDDGISAGVEPDFCTTAHVENAKLVASDDVASPPASKYDVTIAMEQKKSFTDSDQIEIVNYGERILSIQQGRRAAYTALFHCCGDKKIIRWARTTEKDGGFITEITGPASLKPKQEGQRQLLAMLSKTSRELGRAFPELDQTDSSEKLTILCKVGEGATATVYRAKLGEREGVVKVMNKEFEDLANHEHSILKGLNAAGVPRLLASTSISSGSLFFDKLLQPFTETDTFKFTHVRDLLECLKQTHAAGIVHRDIRPENVMLDGEGEVYLIDWGFAVERRISDLTAPGFQGTFRYASDDVLRAAIDGTPYSPSSKDDLESLLKTVLAVNSGDRRLWRQLSEVGPGMFKDAMAIWQHEKTHNMHEGHLSLFAAAAQSNYEGLKKMTL